jgi:hypothetical protein
MALDIANVPKQTVASALEREDECDAQLKHTVETFMILERERLEKEGRRTGRVTRTDDFKLEI